MSSGRRWASARSTASEAAWCSTARVTDVIYQGDTFLVQAAQADGTRLAARCIASQRALARVPAVGDAVRFGLDVEDTVLVVDEGRRA